MNTDDVITRARYLADRMPHEEDAKIIEALIALAEEQAATIAHLVQARAEQADEAQKWRDQHTRLTELGRAFAAVTPCTCSAQRARADLIEKGAGDE